MKITILGTGAVGTTIAARLTGMGHQITMGTRNAKETMNRKAANQMTGESFSDWHSRHHDVQVKIFQEAAPGADLIINATNGKGSLEALKSVGTANLSGKVLIDIANPLDFSQGFPPSLTVCNMDSLAEQIQRDFPDLKVVKTLNTMNASLMMDPSLVPGDHSVFVSGNDNEAKDMVTVFLQNLGWKTKNIIDLGDITTARGTEMMLPLWVRLYGALGTPEFNFHIARGK